MCESSAKIEAMHLFLADLCINLVNRYLLNKQQVNDEQPKVSSFENTEKKKINSVLMDVDHVYLP